MITLLFVVVSIYHCYCSDTDNRISSSQLPLFVKGRYVVDNDGNRVKLACVNWYGAEELDYIVGGMQWQSLSEIVSIIPKYGFNCARLLWSLELLSLNPIINNSTLLKMEPTFIGHNAMYIFDKVIESLTNINIMVILDNHVSDSGWCCSSTDGNGLWYNNNYTATDWMNLWQSLVSRYIDNKFVIGVDLRNEIRSTTINGKTVNPSWGTNDNDTDWRMAAIECSKLIQSKNPDLLIIVEFINYAGDGTGIRNKPILNNDLLIENKLLYEAHNYAWFQSNNSYKELQRTINKKWGYIVQGNISNGDLYTAPVWLGEFGTCHDDTNNCLNSTWWKSINQYLYNYDIPWSFWDYPGTESTAQGRTYGAVDSWGLLNKQWNAVQNMLQIKDLQKLQKPTLTVQ